MRLDPDDSLPIPGIEGTAALPAGLVYDRHIPGVGIKHAQAPYTFGHVFMSHDAGSIGQPENITDRRSAYELTSEGTKVAIRDALAELLTTHRWGHKPLEQTVDAAVAIVLDTVSA